MENVGAITGRPARPSKHAGRDLDAFKVFKIVKLNSIGVAFTLAGAQAKLITDLVINFNLVVVV